MVWMLLRPNGLRLSAALSPIRKSSKVWKYRRPRAVPSSSRQLSWLRKNAPKRRVCSAVHPRQRVGPRSSTCWRWRNRCRACRRGGNSRAGREPSSPAVPERTGRPASYRETRRRACLPRWRFARSASELKRLSLTRLLRHHGSQIHAGHVVPRSQRLRRARARHHGRARIALRRAERPELIDGRQISARPRVFFGESR